MTVAVDDFSRRFSPLPLLVLLLAGNAGCNHFASQGINVDGVRLQQSGHHQAAADRFLQAIARRPDLPDGYYNLAATLHQTGKLYNRPGDLRQAENYYNQCLERDPDHAECYRGLAVLLTETQRTDAAFRLLQGWNDASPNKADPKIELARLLQETGDQDGAQTRLVEALTIDPYNSRALTALGRMRDEAGDFAQALEDYERSLAVNRQQPDVRKRVASLQTALGRPATPSTGDGSRVVVQPSRTVRY